MKWSEHLICESCVVIEAEGLQASLVIAKIIINLVFTDQSEAEPIKRAGGERDKREEGDKRDEREG